MNVFEQLFKKQLSGKYIFRGISEENQKYPSIMRCNGNDLSYLENKMLEQFVIRGSHMLDGNLSPIDIIGYAQHYGLPTRLIDWTLNPFVALYFAINNVSEEAVPRILFTKISDQIMLNKIVSPRTWNDVSYAGNETDVKLYQKFLNVVSNKEEFVNIISSEYTLNSAEESSENIKLALQDKYEKNRFILVQSHLSNPRIIAQQGLYMIPKQLNRKSIMDEYSKSNVGELKINLSDINIHLEMLKKLGITQSKLFCDLQSVCSEIKFDSIKGSKRCDKENKIVNKD